MKSLNEAVIILVTTINEYQFLCINSRFKILSNTKSFFNNHLYKKPSCGQTGYERSVKLLNEIQEKIKNNNINSTEQLIKFARNYETGSFFKKFINRGIRDIAEFHDGHINYLIMIYQQSTGIYKDESTRKIVEELIDSAISGTYEPDLYKHIGAYIGLQKFYQLDYGATQLLECLNNLVPNVSQTINLDNNHFRI